MKKELKVGARAEFTKTVTHEMTVEFEGRALHEFCSTYWLSHLAELVSRMVLEPDLEAHEDGVGTGLMIRHFTPAGVGQTLKLSAVCTELRENYLKTYVEAHVGKRLVSTGEVHQVVVPKSYIEKMEADLLAELQKHKSENS